jgi:hypothetical protein
MFEELERFVAAHQPCGELIGDVGEISEAGYTFRLVCSCWTVFERCMTPEMADHDVLRSRLPAFPN